MSLSLKVLGFQPDSPLESPGAESGHLALPSAPLVGGEGGGSLRLSGDFCCAFGGKHPIGLNTVKLN